MTAEIPTTSITCINDVGKDAVNIHDGACYVGLYAQIATTGVRQDRIFREVISLLQHEETAAEDIALVQPLFHRLVLNGLYVPVSYAEGRALISLCREAEEYWQLCDYANTEGSAIEHLLGSPHIALGGAVCWNQNNMHRRRSIPVGLREKPYRYRYERVKDYS